MNAPGEVVVKGPVGYVMAGAFALVMLAVAALVLKPYLTGNFAITTPVRVGDYYSVDIHGEQDVVHITAVFLGGQQMQGFSVTKGRLLSFTRSDLLSPISEDEVARRFPSPGRVSLAPPLTVNINSQEA